MGKHKLIFIGLYDEKNFGLKQHCNCNHHLMAA